MPLDFRQTFSPADGDHDQQAVLVLAAGLGDSAQHLPRSRHLLHPRQNQPEGQQGGAAVEQVPGAVEHQVPGETHTHTPGSQTQCGVCECCVCVFVFRVVCGLLQSVYGMRHGLNHHV